MKKNILFLALITAALFFQPVSILAENRLIQSAPNNMISVLSPVFPNGGDIPAKFTCDGANAIPELNISDVLPEAKSLAIIVDDPDAPNGIFNHWVIWNIDPSLKKINSSDLGGSTNGRNSAGKNDYVGPCPPNGTHRYFFKVYALDEKLDLDRNSVRDDLVRAMEGHIISQGELMGKYGR
ncbi:MAG TPA: YbhB/YbcL family Raf kinase inhibitor-like protein [Patescibacteria group bacterium]|nr:YbhB/YbcL family Raf kinase inhibitor-like protein [Patescibacteria group bacterium]